MVRSSRRQTCVVGVFVNTVSGDTPDQWLALKGRVLLSVLCCVTWLCDTCVWTVPSLDSPGTRERSSHQYSMKLYVCMLHLFLFASLCECCAFVLPSSASFLSPSPFALAHLWWSAHVVPPGVSLLSFASVPVSSRCTLLKLHLALSLLVACTFSSLTSHCRLTCIGCLVHSLPLSVMVITPFPHPPSTDCHPGIIVNSKFCHGRL